MKEKAIETFIESQPKISKLREDLNFEVKEKTEDISHLMTETLAKLYIEQKLYGKAIKAYEILSAKFPYRKSEFAEKIKKIKETHRTIEKKKTTEFIFSACKSLGYRAFAILLFHHPQCALYGPMWLPELQLYICIPGNRMEAGVREKGTCQLLFKEVS